MIRRINKLKNVGRFAELRSQGGNQHEFAQVNAELFGMMFAGNSLET